MTEPTKAPKRDLTPADAKAYVEGGAGLCPFCDSHSITGGSVEIESTVAWQNVDCADCNAVWQDIYHLVRIDVRDTPDGRTFEPDGYPPLNDPQQSNCVRCGTDLKDGRCGDATCPFSDYAQDDRRGWAGHPSPPEESA